MADASMANAVVMTAGEVFTVLMWIVQSVIVLGMVYVNLVSLIINRWHGMGGAYTKLPGVEPIPDCQGWNLYPTTM